MTVAIVALACMIYNEREKAENAPLALCELNTSYFPVPECNATNESAQHSIDQSAYPFHFCNQLNKTNYMSAQSLSLTAGIVTDQLQACQKFYSTHFGFKVIYESDWFVLLSTPGGTQQISFLQPGHPSQQPLFQPAFAGKGVYFTLEVEDVEAEYHRLKKAGIPILIDLRKEPWGDTHFAIQDPAGVAVDIVTYQAPE